MSDLSFLGVSSESPLLFLRPGGGRIKITEEVLAKWALYVQRTHSSREAGGVLLGRRIIESKDIVIDDVSEPSPEDRRSRFSFHRTKKAHQKRIEEAWRESSGALNYLGEWHTHPEDRPTPSCVDRMDWKNLMKKCRFEGDELFFFIVGIECVSGWEVNRFRMKIEPLRAQK